MKLPSLSARITTLLVVTSLGVLGGGAMLMDWRIDHEVESRFQQNLLARASALSSMVELEGDLESGEPRPSLPEGVLGVGNHAWYQLQCDGHPPRSSKPAPPFIPPGWDRRTPAQPIFESGSQGGRHVASVRFAFPASVGDAGEAPASKATGRRSPPAMPCRLLFVQDRRAVDQMLLAVDWILLLGPLLALAIALLAVPLIVQRGLRPVASLVERMRDIGPSSPGQRLSPSGLRELDPLVDRFNDVLERMDEGLARERQFASGLAHETRTRLAELRALAEVESRYPSGRPLPDVLADVGQIGAELEATVAALLLLTRLQSGVEPPQRQWLATGSWLQRQQQRYADAAASRRVDVHIDADPAIELYTDPALLEVVVGNLLANACHYAPIGDTVMLRADAHGLSIDNAAPDLDPSDLAHLGQRFWRKQVPDAGHAGLGLALANAAADALGLTLAFRLAPDRRLHASLNWPADEVRTPAR